jgi:hypothetical protein
MIRQLTATPAVFYDRCCHGTRPCVQAFASPSIAGRGDSAGLWGKPPWERRWGSAPRRAPPTNTATSAEEQAKNAEAYTAGNGRVSGVDGHQLRTGRVCDGMGKREQGARPVRSHRPGWCR